ncbi:hypothetical protein ACH5RR_024053 [Cinchona calisaya]|uniref:Ripening-related protein 1 n=1 Tax=Cinchona calisaya TaxID=153742 RepID=A0ABD2ZE86_9GENT
MLILRKLLVKNADFDKTCSFEEASVLAFWISFYSQTCNPSGKLRGKKPPSGQCNTINDSECCVKGQNYPTFECSPRVSRRTKAVLTLNSFEEGGDGGGASSCDGEFHSDETPVVALSTGWFDNRRRCLSKISIFHKGKSVDAIVVDECDSNAGCDAEHDFQPPCRNNIVDGSKAVWEGLGIAEDEWGELDVFWTDA